MTAKADIRLLTLEEAAEYLGASVTVQALRTEIRKGRLTPTEIAGKYFVTEADLRGLIRKCRVAESPSRHGSTCEGEPDGSRGGSSSTAEKNTPPDALKATADRLKNLSRGTSKTSTAPRQGRVVPIK